MYMFYALISLSVSIAPIYPSVVVKSRAARTAIQDSIEYRIDWLEISGPSNWILGQSAALLCKASPDTTNLNFTSTANLTGFQTRGGIGEIEIEVKQVRLEHAGNYSCKGSLPVNAEISNIRTVTVRVFDPVRIIDKTGARSESGKDTHLFCSFTGLPVGNISWRIVDSGLSELLPENINTAKVNDTYVETRLIFRNVNKVENGTYECAAEGEEGVVATAHVDLLVLGKPEVQLDVVKAVGMRTLFVNWTVNDGNDPVKQFFVSLRKNGTDALVHYPEMIPGRNSSALLRNLDPETGYQVSLSAKNSYGNSKVVEYPTFVRTLDSDPEFVPAVEVKGSTSDSISIAWTQPRMDERDFVNYYQIELHKNGTRHETYHPVGEMNVYMFTKLEPSTTYAIRIAACSEFTRVCGAWSVEVNGTTLEGPPPPPEDLALVCRHDNISHTSFVHVTWSPPASKQALISHFAVQLQGTAIFRSSESNSSWTNATYGPKVKTAANVTATFDGVPAYTNYTVKVAVVNRMRHKSPEAIANCSMPATVPGRDDLGRIYWTRLQLEPTGPWLFRLTLKRISERNGPIVCYIVYVVRLRPGQLLVDLPPPEDLPVSTFHTAHESYGAYIAEIIDPTSDYWPSEVLIGDGKSLTSSSKCLELFPKPPLAEIVGFNNESSRSRRDFSDVAIAYDGFLDSESNYTGFVKVIVSGENGTLLPAYSNYMIPLAPAPRLLIEDGSELTIAMYLLIGLVIVIIFMFIILLILHNYTKSVSEEQGIDMSLTTTLMHLCRQVTGRHVAVPSRHVPPDVPPIAETHLPEAVVERSKDSDYGFQREFEMLPDRFPDRTTRASEARENQSKNRYPDIKAYDQTRVKLTQVDGVVGSDYINANHVLGYKERRKFICAQGPMENTVEDFWRLIWEQHLEMVLMLTNLEEYSKSKCAKYWPELGAGEMKFGALTVTAVKETRFAEHLVRELNVKNDSGEQRRIVQYHYLAWKDFSAPDSPTGILKFLKKLNEEHTVARGPVLVHCSAGVGRTGTLVALDVLIQQLKEEKQVAVFNIVADLRHQRNFLVQSLKQYIFIYRALLEVTLRPDAECKVSALRSRSRSEFELEFGRLENLHELKGFSNSVACAEENQPKNRNQEVVPLDRNRVILSPLPGKDHSTYINASFVDGYSSEAWIVAQDPLPQTIPDFWRMVSEHEIHTLVMLSELGEGKCPRYWPEPDQEAVYDHIKVKYIQSESCPYYTRREFAVTHIRSGDTITTTQFQYNGWPTVEGGLPEVTRGLTDLVQHVVENVQAPGAVHCSQGDRSAIFVALTILVQQMQRERTVDVFATVRKLRAQRPNMISQLAHYEFLYRALINHADLHHMMGEMNGSAVTASSPVSDSSVTTTT